MPQPSQALIDFAKHPDQLPNFSAVQSAEILPALQQLIEQNRQQLSELLDRAKPQTWENYVEPLEAREDRLSKLWSIVSHLNKVCDNDALRVAYQAGLELLTTYHTELSQNTHLYQAYQSIADSEAFKTASPAQQATITHALRDFKLSGAGLPDAERQQFADLVQQASKLSTQFNNNVLDATDNWTMHITDPGEMAGIPATIQSQAQTRAKQQGKTGWLLNLEMPCYFAVLTNAQSRSLRETCHRAYTTRASDQGPHAGQWDNSDILCQLVNARQQMAQLIGYPDYASMVLQQRMVQAPEEVIDFLYDIAAKTRTAAEAQAEELLQFAQQHCDIEALEAWDTAFVSEQMRQTLFDCDDEALRPYFPINQVLDGLFDLLGQLFNISFEAINDADTWHPLVQVYQLRDADQNTLGHLYMDLYARPHKNSGAWMSECRPRRRLADGHIQTPIAFLTCNFNAPIGDQPALLTHDEVLTLFHEYGHCLHHLLSQQDIASISGMAGVPWDAIELPSQLLELWTWQKPMLKQLGKHVDTGEALPEQMIDNLLQTHTFHAALTLTGQLTYSLFDFKLHQLGMGTTPEQVQALLDEVRKAVSLHPHIPENRFQHSFLHIFAGGYAAGYYSYLWAEVLSSDAFSLFEENGLFDQKTGASLWQHILATGGSIPPTTCFKHFRGRPATLDAWLRHHGISNTKE